MTPHKVFVVAIEPVVDAAGTTETHLFCSAPWATSPTDVPANTTVRPYLQNAGTFKQELFSGARVTGAIRPAFGNITLANPAPTVGSEGPFDSWLGYGLTGAKVTVRWGVIGDAYPSQWETVYIAYVAGAIVDTSNVTLRLRDRLYLLDAPVVTEGFDGSGGLEGSGSVPKLKQFVAGSAGFIPPILVDAIKQIYFVQSTSDGGMRASWVGNPNEVSQWDVFENGVEITRAATDYASEADLLAAAPASGEVKYYWGPDSTWAAGWKTGPIYFRLGTPPVGELRVYVNGYTTDDDMARLGSVSGSFSLATMAMRAGVDRDSIETQNVSVQMAMVDDETSFLDVMSGACLAYESWFGFTRLDTFRDGYLCDPEDDGIWYGIDWAGAGMGAAPTAQPTTSVHTITPDNGKELRREPVNGMEAPVWKVTVKARKTWPCPVASGASDTMRDYLTRDPWWATFQGFSDTCLVANPGAITATVEIPYADFPNVFSRRLFLERYFVLFGGRRDLFTVTVPLETASLAINLHDVVTLEWPRLGLGGGVKCRVVSIFIDCSAAVPSMRLGLWTGEIGEFTGTVSMVPPGGVGATPVPSYLQIGRQRLENVTQFAYGTVSGVGGGGFAGYARHILANITQTAYGEIAGASFDPNTAFIAGYGSGWTVTDGSGTGTLAELTTETAAVAVVEEKDTWDGGGKWYWEVHIGGTPNTSEAQSPCVGLSVASQLSNGGAWDILIGADEYAWGYQRDGTKVYNGTASSYGDTFTAGDVIGVAYDYSAGKIWFSKNGVWQGSGDPAAGTDEAFSGVTAGRACVSADMGAPTIEFFWLDTEGCTYSAPSGFDYLGNASTTS